ncbi:M1 family metallopeptidase [Micromonospora sp. WMMD1128]|uniref:M1 family metallopeptidase n=1 Tax=unclassified Micromonospora TaxID=2617518 RepID=UPI00248B27FA|nr:MULTISPECIES: M1 family metallopeptidase [unclassified Micromonospora]WBB74524.1 M1 family metallopeptidase [Micromonospora sp. WMMD1128]WFE32113.1 M1 family metallopeptidase [Micromonospora sp. WMMD975]
MARRGGRRRLGLLACGTLLLAGCGSAEPDRSAAVPSESGPTAARSFAPGAAGAGDAYFPTYGNGGYDVASYTIKVRYDPDTDKLTGTTTVRATATADLSAFNLDLAGLTVRSVTVDGAAARHARTDDELVVTPAAGLTSGNGFVAEIRYGGRPEALRSEALGEGGWLHTADGAIALGQPQSASTWFPVNDHPSDKATYDVEITVPKGLTAVGNGVPKGKTTAGDWTTWRWSEGSPMASYLTTVVIGKFRVTTAEHKGRPVWSAVTTQLPEGAPDRSIARTVEVADYLESIFGPYPFGAYGGVVVADSRIRYALETQSRPVYGSSFFRRGDNTDVVAHELAHQWYGDSVSIRRWQDIWLNEGLATYAEWLWAEHTGKSTVQRTFEQKYAGASALLWRTPPGKPGVENLFGSSVYDRGGMTVHALRVAVGDTAFFTILRTWAAERKDGNATTADFVALAERVSGKKLDKLFDAWLFGTERPAAPKPK